MKRKENKAMRLASVLLVLTLLSTSMIAGTFAKYVTEETKTATARVAKFGVDIKVDADELFGTQYNKDGAVVTDNNNITVSAQDMVVAPGTKGSMTFFVSGTPETDVELKVSIEGDIKEVMLDEGIYKYEEEGETAKEVTLAEAYYPVKWTLTDNTDSIPVTDGGKELKNTSLTAIKEYFNKDTSKKTYKAETDLSKEKTYTLSWEWPYDASSANGTGANDGADTILGNLQANVEAAPDDIIKITKDDQGNALTEGTDYNLTESFTFTIKVEQAD